MPSPKHTTFPPQAQACPLSTAFKLNTKKHPGHHQRKKKGPVVKNRLNDHGRTIIYNWLDQNCRDINARPHRHVIQTVIKQVQVVGNEWFNLENLRYYMNQRYKRLQVQAVQATSQPAPVAPISSPPISAAQEEELLFGQIPLATRTSLQWLFQANTGDSSLSHWALKYSLTVQDIKSYFDYLRVVGIKLFPNIPVSAKLALQSLLRLQPNADHQRFRLWAERTGVKVADVTAYIIHLRGAAQVSQQLSATKSYDRHSHLPTPISLSRPSASAQSTRPQSQRAAPAVPISSAGSNVMVIKTTSSAPAQHARDSSAGRAEHQRERLPHSLGHADADGTVHPPPDPSAAARTPTVYRNAPELERTVGAGNGTTTDVLKQGRGIDRKGVVGTVSHAGSAHFVATHDGAGADVTQISTRASEDSAVRRSNSEGSGMKTVEGMVGGAMDVDDEPHRERRLKSMDARISSHLAISSWRGDACETSDQDKDDEESDDLSEMEIDELKDDDEDPPTVAETKQNVTMVTTCNLRQRDVFTRYEDIVDWMERNGRPPNVLCEFTKRLKSSGIMAQYSM